jgi:hypothetical protein
MCVWFVDDTLIHPPFSYLSPTFSLKICVFQLNCFSLDSEYEYYIFISLYLHERIMINNQI